MRYSDRLLSRRHWRVANIPYGCIERGRVDTKPEMFYLLASASFVEITSDLYTRRLLDYFDDDSEVSGWLEQHWQHEELQHGSALKCHVNCVWPNFDWERAYAHFYSEYSRRCTAKQLGPTRRSKWVLARGRDGHRELVHDALSDAHRAGATHPGRPHQK